MSTTEEYTPEQQQQGYPGFAPMSPPAPAPAAVTPLEVLPTDGQYFPVTELPRHPATPPVVREVGADNPDSQPPVTYGSQPAEAPSTHLVAEGKQPIVVDTPLIWQVENANVLHSTAGNWQTDEGEEPRSRFYRWLKDGMVIPMALAEDYNLLPEDDGGTFVCYVTVANDYGSSLPALSNEIVAAYIAAPEEDPVPEPTAPEPPNMVPEVAVTPENTHIPPEVEIDLPEGTVLDGGMDQPAPPVKDEAPAYPWQRG